MEREFVIRSLLQCSLTEQPKYTQLRTKTAAVAAAAVVAAAAPSTATTESQILWSIARAYISTDTHSARCLLYCSEFFHSSFVHFSILHWTIVFPFVERLCHKQLLLLIQCFALFHSSVSLLFSFLNQIHFDSICIAMLHTSFTHTLFFSVSLSLSMCT